MTETLKEAHQLQSEFAKFNLEVDDLLAKLEHVLGKEKLECPP
jgi:hypothetical protein